MVVSAPDADGRNEVVNVDKLVKRYRRTSALLDVSLRIRQGEIFGLIGPDGSGKSSLIRIIAGVQKFDSGSVTVLHQEIDSERSAERIKGRIGLMPQGLGNNLYANLSVNENIGYFAGLRLVEPEVLGRRRDRLLAITRLGEFCDRPMKQLSGGMKQKLGLICTLIHQPELVLLDEPTTGVDPVSRRDFWAILTELVHDSGMTAIVSTAYMDEAAYMDRLALMMDGRVMSQGHEDRIAALLEGTIVTGHAPDALATADRLRRQYRHVQTMGDTIRVWVPDRGVDEARQSVAQIAAVSVSSLATSAPDLDDALACMLDKSRRGEPANERGGSRPPPDASLGSPRSRAVAIRAHQLVRDFGHFRAVDQVSFEVEAGRIFGLLGSNGAGKTTVIKMLTGLLPATQGSGNVAGADIKRSSHAIRERIGYMSQSFSLYLDMTTIENLEFYAGVYGLFPWRSRTRIDQLMATLGLEEFRNRITSDLPMGIRQRLALGCALVHRPRVVFLDEPTSGVDVLGRRQFWEILVRLAREDGVAILVTTHYMVEAEQCDGLALMYAGRVVAAGTPASLRAGLEAAVGAPLELVTTAPLRALQIAKANGYRRAALFGRSLRILTRSENEDEDRLRDLLGREQIEVTKARSEPVTMEDVFVDSILAQESEPKAEAVK